MTDGPLFIRRWARKAWHLVIGHEWVDRTMTEIHCRCGATRNRADWG